MGALEDWNPQYLVETKVAPHTKFQDALPAPKPFHPPLNRAAVMMCCACPSRTMWRSVPKAFGRWAVGWTVMWARARWWAFFPASAWGGAERVVVLASGVVDAVWGDVYSEASDSAL